MKTITSVQNDLVKHWVKLRKNGDYRYDRASVLVEGMHMVKEVSVHIKPSILILTDETVLDPHLEKIKAKEKYLVSHSVMQKISGLEASEGVIAEMPMPPFQSLNKCSKIVVLDGIQDPGNLGALIRTALALGWDGAYLLDPCCDPYNDKALRAAKGATFRFPLAHGHWEDFQKLLKSQPWQLIAAELKGKSLKSLEKNPKKMLFLGHETHGISPEIRKIATSVTIPMSGKMESLNVSVAGGILMNLLNDLK